MKFVKLIFAAALLFSSNAALADLQTDLENKSGQIESLKDDIDAASASMTTKISDLNDLIDQIDLPPPEPAENPAYKLRASSCGSVGIGYYPYEIKYHEGFMYISTVGGNAGGTENARFYKFNPDTCSFVSSYSAGPYYSGGVYYHGYNGFTIIGDKAYAARNRMDLGTSFIDVINLSNTTLDRSISVGTGALRGVTTDGEDLYFVLDGPDNLKKVDLSASDAISTLYTFTAGSKPFKVEYTDGKLVALLFNAHQIKFFDTDGTLRSTINTGASTSPNWATPDGEGNIFVSYYYGHKAVKIDMDTESIVTTYNLPAADYPHQALPVMGQLWVGGTTTPTSYIRVFNIATGSLITSYAKGENIPTMAFDGQKVWNVSANGNYLYPTSVDLIWNP